MIISKVIAISIAYIGSDVFTGQGYGKINHFIEVKDTCDLIVLGSSRANHHIDPAQITSRSYNMGMDGRKFFFHATMFYLVADSSTVLFHIDPSDFFDNGESMNRIIPHYGKLEQIDKALREKEQISILERTLGSLRFNNTLLSIIGNKFNPGYNPCDYHGYDPIILSQRDSLLWLGKKLANKVPEKIITDSMNQEIFAELAQIKRHSDSMDIDCIFFTSPTYHGHSDHDKVFMDSIFENADMAYYDYSDYLKHTDVMLWKDDTHLSHEGAKIFMRRIFQDIEGFL